MLQTDLKHGNYDVLNVLDPLLLSGLDVAKELYVTLNFRLANLLGEHMKTPMRSLLDVMSIPIFYFGSLRQRGS